MKKTADQRKIESLQRQIDKLKYELNYEKESASQYKLKYEKEAAKSMDCTIAKHVMEQKNEAIEKLGSRVSYLNAENDGLTKHVHELKTTIKTLNSLYHDK